MKESPTSPATSIKVCNETNFRDLSALEKLAVL